VVWLIHLAFLLAATVATIAMLWSVVPGFWRWVAIGFFAYCALTSPFTIAAMLRTYWNAPQAAERNRQLLTRQA
jgi:protein-S-isoprenylcysteine O-methyltransferase Ste14